METGVYCIFNKANNKTYIGSSINIRLRKNRHICLLRKGVHINSHLQNAWNKYGEDNFRFVILVLCNSDELISTEQLFIDIFKPHYNIRKIAESNLGISLSKETREKMSVSLKKIHREKFGISVIMMDLEGNFVKKCDSLAEAAELTKTSPGNIFKIVSKKTKSYNGFTFVYESEYNQRECYKVKRNNGKYLQKPVNMYDKNLNLIRTFDNLVEAVTIMNIKRTGISNCLSGKSKSSGGYIWKY